MTQYWCVNFDSEECLKHGIKHDLWMMQYQYEDDLGNTFQGGRQKAATTANWRRLTEIRAGDWFVAYLPKKRTANGNTFFAIGKVCFPRKPPKSEAHVSTVAEYVSAQQSHQYKSGVVHYTDAPVFYEDFDDKWRSDDPLMRYAQRIDVEEWQNYAAGGISWLPGLTIPRHEIQRAFFKIDEKSFDKIRKRLTTLSDVSQESRKRQVGPGKIVDEADEAAVEALEKNHAKSQGFVLDSELRKALEKYSMEAAIQHFRSLGYTVEDCSKDHPYDLKCVRENETLYVEVKGTQTNGKGVILTSGEVEFARRHKSQMALFVLHSISVSKDQTKLSNGVQLVIHPWVVEHGALNPLSYKYDVPEL